MTQFYVAEYGFDHPVRRAARGGVLAAGRRAARGRRLDVRQVGRAQGHLVGAVGVAGSACSSCPTRRPT